MAKKTELVFVLDCSGSMEPLTADAVGGFNSTLATAKSEAGEVLVTTVLFNDTVRTLHDRIPVGDVPVMQKKDYGAYGSTALLDALGSTVTHIDTIHRYARPEDLPDRTVFFITTDGMENASRTYTAEQVKELISAHEKAGWEFHFLAANIDAVSTARGLGIRRGRAMRFDATPDGMREGFACMARIIETENKENEND